MNLFQMILVGIAALIVTIWVGNLPSELRKLKNKKDEFLISDNMLSEDEKQKIRAEEYIDLYTKLKYMDKIYITDQGTVLNSKPHTFKDFINNQKLPSKLELIWEILADNNVTIKDIIQRIEDDGPYDPNSKFVQKKVLLKVTKEQKNLLSAINLTMSAIKIDDNYPLFVRIEGTLAPSGHVLVTYQAGYGYNETNPSHERHTRPTKH